MASRIERPRLDQRANRLHPTPHLPGARRGLLSLARGDAVQPVELALDLYRPGLLDEKRPQSLEGVVTAPPVERCTRGADELLDDMLQARVRGSLTLLLATDVKRYAPLITWWGSAAIVFGVLLAGIDLTAGMPISWMLGEVVFTICAGVAVLLLQWRSHTSAKHAPPG